MNRLALLLGLAMLVVGASETLVSTNNRIVLAFEPGLVDDCAGNQAAQARADLCRPITDNDSLAPSCWPCLGCAAFPCKEECIMAVSKSKKASKGPRTNPRTIKLAEQIYKFGPAVARRWAAVIENLPGMIVSYELREGQRFDPVMASVYRLSTMLCTLGSTEVNSIERAISSAIIDGTVGCMRDKGCDSSESLRLVTVSKRADRKRNDEDSGYDGWMDDPSPRLD